MLTVIITDIHIGMTAKKIVKFRKFVKDCVARGVERILISGDIAISSLSQVEQAFKAIREVSKDIEVMVVFGNHDYWDEERKYKSIFELTIARNKLCKDYDIHYLQHNHYEDENIQIFGYDGWYIDPNVERFSNDPNYMPGSYVSAHYLLNSRATEAVQYITSRIDKTKKVVVLTHFNPIHKPDKNSSNPDKFKPLAGNPVAFQKILEKGCDLFIYGHTHIREDTIMDEYGTRVVNVGADYYHAPSFNNAYHLLLDI